MTPLRQLIESVEAGKIYLPDSDKWSDLPMSGYLPSKAFNGSLDAALALHEVLLPGWGYAAGYDGQHYFADVFKAGVYSGTSISHNPARTMLLAILRAYEAQQEGEG